MKRIPEKHALERLKKIKDAYRAEITNNYEHRAKSCLNCETKGACCVDAHFVNVHITRLESVAIRNALDKLPPLKREGVYARIENAITDYGLTDEGDTFAQTYACPLFEKEIGCLVHEEGKPLPCIQHACYESEHDLPPDILLTEQEELVESLNKRTYNEIRWRPLPLWLATPRSK